MIYAICGGCLFILILIIIIVRSYNNFRFAIIKIDEAENNIDVFLKKKYDLLQRTRPIIKKEIKLDSFLDDMEYLEDSKINHFMMNSSLKKLHDELIKVLDENDKLSKSEKLTNILEEMNANEEAMIGCIKFYNDNVVEFNKLVGVFPSNIVALLWHFKRKDFYSNEKREMYEILNEK